MTEDDQFYEVAGWARFLHQSGYNEIHICKDMGLWVVSAWWDGELEDEPHFIQESRKGAIWFRYVFTYGNGWFVRPEDLKHEQ